MNRNILDRLERRYGRYAVKGLARYLVGGNVLVLIFLVLEPTGRLLDALILRPGLVLGGEIWRLVTFLFIPPTTSLFWAVFALYFYYLVGTGLESAWGSFRLNLYYITGAAAAIAAAFLTGRGATAVYLNLSLFLAFAHIYPDFEVLIFFVLPVKVKYLAWLDWAFIAYTAAVAPVAEKVAALASIVNFLLFFGGGILRHAGLWQKVRANRRRFLADLRDAPPRHECAVCHRTEKTHPRLVFRTCRRCAGWREYCEDHLLAHEHIGAEGEGAEKE
ncbi:MAG: hypothetical protein ACM3X6_00205 [Patescibacteria group bacterium]